MCSAHSLSIHNNFLHYHADQDLPHKDKSWQVELSSIRVIGFVNRMDFDDDSDFLVLIDSKAHKFIIKNPKQVAGWEEMEHKLADAFPMQLPVDFHDSDIVLYPPEIAGSRLYRFSLGTYLRNLAALQHVAEGKLSEEVEACLSNQGAGKNAQRQ